MTSSNLRTEGYASGDRSRQDILDAALHLFARDGINAVSMRSIAQAAGQANVSATQYYFGGKRNLVSAILQHIYGHLAPMRQLALDEVVNETSPNDPDYIRKILNAGFAPHVALLAEGQWGQDAIKFTARLVWEAGPDIRKELISTFNHDANRIVGLLQKALPNVPAKTLQLRFMFSLTNLIHGLADLEILEDSPFGPLVNDLGQQASELAHSFMDYVVGGITQVAPTNMPTQTAT